MFSRSIDKDLKLVLPMPHDAEEIAAVVRENLEHLREWLPWATDEYSTETARQFIQKNLEHLAEDGSFGASIVYQNKIAGGIGFVNTDRTNSKTEIGYWLAAAHQGKGIVTRCCEVFIDFAFNEYALNRVEIRCLVENVKSRAIPERLGFNLEGVFRQSYLLHNRLQDLVVYAMLKQDWRK